MIRPDTQSFIDRVVDPELHRLRETRDALARQLWQRSPQMAWRIRAAHNEGFILLMGALAQISVVEEAKARLYGTSAAHALLHQNGA